MNLQDYVIKDSSRTIFPHVREGYYFMGSGLSEKEYEECCAISSYSLQKELRQFKAIFPTWTEFMLKCYIRSDLPTESLLKEYHEMWCRRRDIRLVDFFRRVYKMLPRRILLQGRDYFEYVTDGHCCKVATEKIDLRKMFRGRELRLKMRAVFHVVTLFSYLKRRIDAFGDEDGEC